MRTVLIDGDACPDVKEIIKIAKEYNLNVKLFMDYAHMVQTEECEVFLCDVGHDSVDMTLLNHTKSNDIVVTQDYGLAGLAIGKGAKVIHVSGKIISSENIDGLLMSRYVSAKERKKKKHLKGPPKRTEDIRMNFLNQLRYIIERK